MFSRDAGGSRHAGRGARAAAGNATKVMGRFAVPVDNYTSQDEKTTAEDMRVIAKVSSWS